MKFGKNSSFLYGRYTPCIGVALSWLVSDGLFMLAGVNASVFWACLVGLEIKLRRVRGRRRMGMSKYIENSMCSPSVHYPYLWGSFGQHSTQASWQFAQGVKRLSRPHRTFLCEHSWQAITRRFLLGRSGSMIFYSCTEEVAFS